MSREPLMPTPRRSALTAWPLHRALVGYFAGSVAAAIALWTAIGLLVVHVYEGGWLHRQETRVNVWLEDSRTDSLTEWSRWMTRLADTEIIIGFAVLFSLFAIVRWRRWIDAIFVFGSLGTQAAVFFIVSLIVDRDRPPVEQLDGSLPTASFPSGHTGAATAFYGSLIVVSLWHLRRPVLRLAVPAVIAMFPIAVIASRLYRGMHYPSDIAAGLFNGLLSILVMAWILRMGLSHLSEKADADELAPEALQFVVPQGASEAVS